MYSIWNRATLCLLLASFCAPAVAQEANAQEANSPQAAASEKAAMQKGDAPAEVAAAKPATPRGRLPRYFGSLVDDVQRLEIYQIQATYRTRIKQLQDQLAQLQSQQMKEIEQTLTSAQRERLSELRGRGAGGRSRSTEKPEVASGSTDEQLTSSRSGKQTSVK